MNAKPQSKATTFGEGTIFRLTNFLKNVLSIDASREEVIELYKLFKKLEQLRAQGKLKEIRYLDEIIPIQSSTVGEIKKRLNAEIEFYKKLYRKLANQKYAIRFEPFHRWPDGLLRNDVIVFECPPGKPIDYTSFESKSNAVLATFLQGEQGANIQLANRILGRQWYEVFMERIVSAFKPLHSANVTFLMKSKTELEKKVRDRFLKPNPDYFYQTSHELNPAKKRVQRILRL